MNGIMFIFSDLLQLTGCDPWQAQCIETLTLLFVFAPIVAGPASGTGGVGQVQTGRQRPDPRCKAPADRKDGTLMSTPAKEHHCALCGSANVARGRKYCPECLERRAQDTGRGAQQEAQGSV